MKRFTSAGVTSLTRFFPKQPNDVPLDPPAVGCQGRNLFRAVLRWAPREQKVDKVGKSAGKAWLRRKFRGKSGANFQSTVRQPFQPWRCAYFRPAPAAIIRSGSALEKRIAAIRADATVADGDPRLIARLRLYATLLTCHN
jgi:hypothetical protein